MARARSHFTQHVMLKSTLLISTVLDTLSPEVVAMLGNNEAIGIHQDPWGLPARSAAQLRFHCLATPL